MPRRLFVLVRVFNKPAQLVRFLLPGRHGLSPPPLPRSILPNRLTTSASFSVDLLMPFILTGANASDATELSEGYLMTFWPGGALVDTAHKKKRSAAPAMAIKAIAYGGRAEVEEE